MNNRISLTRELVIEDDGVSTDYKNGETATTTIGLVTTPEAVAITISAADGSFDGYAAQRAYQLSIII